MSRRKQPWDALGERAATDVLVRGRWDDIVRWLGPPAREPDYDVRAPRAFFVSWDFTGWRSTEVACTCGDCMRESVRVGDPWPAVLGHWTVTARESSLLIGCQSVPVRMVDAVLDARRRMLRKPRSRRTDHEEVPVRTSGRTGGRVKCSIYPDGSVGVDGRWSASYSSEDVRALMLIRRQMSDRAAPSPSPLHGLLRRLLRARRLLAARTKVG